MTDALEAMAAAAAASIAAAAMPPPTPPAALVASKADPGVGDRSFASPNVGALLFLILCFTVHRWRELAILSLIGHHWPQLTINLTGYWRSYSNSLITLC